MFLSFGFDVKRQSPHKTGDKTMHTNFFRQLLKMGTAVLVTACATTTAFAEFPDKPIKLVVPFAPGGGTDLIARTLSIGMQKALGQSVIVDNKPGGGTIIGTDAVAKSAPDGYTLVMATFAHAVNPSMQPKLPFDTSKAFAPVTMVARGPNVLVVKADSPIKSVKDLLAAAKSSPGKLTYASQGNGTSAHLAGEMFSNLAKVEMVHVPYRGAGPAITDLLGGQVDMIFGTAAAVSAFIDSGKLRALGVTSPQASPAFKGVPAIADTVPGYQVESWYGIYAPAGTPPDVVAKLGAAAAAAARGPEFSKKIEPEGLAVIASTPAELDAYVKAEEQRWKKIVKENNIKPD